MGIEQGMMPGMGMPGMDGFGADDPDTGVSAMDESDVGRTLNVVSGGRKGLVTKTLLLAGDQKDFDLPMKGWRVVVSYVARVAADGKTEAAEPFETVKRTTLELGCGELPPGVEDGISTMREGEESRLTIQPERAFGAEGDPRRGVPGDSAVEYEVTLHETIMLTSLRNGAILKYRLKKPTMPSYERASKHDEITCRWSGTLMSDESVFREE